MTEPEEQYHSLLNIYELMEAMFLYLEPRDIVRASATCRYWHDCVKSHALLRKIHKMPVPCIEGTNPHFITPSQACRNALIPTRSGDAGDNVLDLYTYADIQLLENMNPGISDGKLQGVLKEYRDYRHGWRAAFMGVRFPDGWPVQFRTYCDLCEGFHPRFRFDHIHPLLSFLEDMTLCVHGHGSQLILNLRIVHEEEAPDSCYDHYMDEVRWLAKNLKWAHENMEDSGLSNDQFMRPVCTRLIARAEEGYHIADNADGITLAEIIPLLIRAFKSNISSTQDFMHWMVSTYSGGDVSRYWRTHRDRIAAFPTEDDWKEFDKNFYTRVEMWDDLLWEINELMKGLPAWSETLLWIERRDAGLLVDETSGRTVHHTLVVTATDDANADEHDGSDEEVNDHSERDAEDDGDAVIEGTED